MYPQICTKRAPFHYVRVEMAIPPRVLSGEHPKRPTDEDCGGHAMPEDLWETALECWSMEPKDRPSTKILLEWLESGLRVSQGIM
jgi:hypothetical protein